MRMKLPLEASAPIHFVGIGGIGMSGIAEVLHTLGYQVQGSDINGRQRMSSACAREGHPRRFVGHDAEHIWAMPQVVVVSTAVKRDNPELVAARAQAPDPGGPPRRDAGRTDAPEDGPSPSAAPTARPPPPRWSPPLLEKRRSLDPTVINGGIVNAYGTNTRMGAERLDGGRGR